MTQVHSISMPNFREQARRAEALMDRYEQYAASIGCELFQDCIHATTAQSELLYQWWKTNARPILNEEQHGRA